MKAVLPPLLTQLLLLTLSAGSGCANQQQTASVQETGFIGQIDGDSGWRRTAYGWQKTPGWNTLRAARKPYPTASQLHPLVVAALLVLFSIGALVYFSET